MRQDLLKKHGATCQTGRKGSLRNVAQLKLLSGAKTFFARERWFKVLVEEYGWRPTHASRALLEKPASERFDRFVKRMSPNREEAETYF